MTRDPSDGSVRPKIVDEAIKIASEIGRILGDEYLERNSLPPIDSREADQLATLQRSRDWLSKYRTNPEAVARLKGDTDPTGEQRGE